MTKPSNFSWVEPARLAAHAWPKSREELIWLRSQGIQIIMNLTEHPLRKQDVEEAGLLAIHEPILDFDAPSLEQLDRCISAIRNALDKKMPITIHCRAGQGRTGTILTAWKISQGLEPVQALAEVRRLRPGSVETAPQIEAIHAWHQTRFASKNSKPL